MCIVPRAVPALPLLLLRTSWRAVACPSEMRFTPFAWPGQWSSPTSDFFSNYVVMRKSCSALNLVTCQISASFSNHRFSHNKLKLATIQDSSNACKCIQKASSQPYLPIEGSNVLRRTQNCGMLHTENGIKSFVKLNHVNNHLDFWQNWSLGSFRFSRLWVLGVLRTLLIYLLHMCKW